MKILFLLALVGALDLPPTDRALEWATEHRIDAAGVSCDVVDTDNNQYVDCLLLIRKSEHMVLLECTESSAPWQDCREKNGANLAAQLTKEAVAKPVRPKPKPTKNSEGEQMICLPAEQIEKMKAEPPAQ